MLCVPWQVTQPGSPLSSNLCFICVSANSFAILPWHVPQALATEFTPGGKAP